MKKSRIIFLIFGGALALASLVLIVRHASTCGTVVRTVTVRGSSLHGVVEGGEQVRMEYGYYQCHPIERGDIVEYQYAGAETPLIKIVKAIPGDRWGLVKNARGRFAIFVNGETLKNSFGAPYEIDAIRAQMLQLYINDYAGVIPPDAYLLLGNLPGGSVDGTRFGLVKGGELIGRVQIRK